MVLGIDDFSSYLLLSYLANTLAKTTTDLVPNRPQGSLRKLEEWLATGFGIGLALLTGVDLLADLGLDVAWEPLGSLVTGLLMGHGAQFALTFVRNAPFGTGGAPRTPK